MKTAKLAVAGVVLAASTVATVAQAASPWTGNIGLTSNYLWRGVTQTTDQAAIQGGMDYDFGNGFTIGAWASNVDFSGTTGTELDVYGSYKIGLGKDMSLDVGAIEYKYFGINQIDFQEVFAKFNFKKLVLAAYMTIDKESDPQDEDDMYLMASYSFDIGKDKTLTLTVGDYNFDDPTNTPTSGDYSHVRAALSKGEFTFAVDNNDYDGQPGQSRFSIMWAKSFDM